MATPVDKLYVELTDRDIVRMRKDLAGAGLGFLLCALTTSWLSIVVLTTAAFRPCSGVGHVIGAGAAVLLALKGHPLSPLRVGDRFFILAGPSGTYEARLLRMTVRLRSAWVVVAIGSALGMAGLIVGTWGINGGRGSAQCIDNMGSFLLPLLLGMLTVFGIATGASWLQVRSKLMVNRQPNPKQSHTT